MRNGILGIRIDVPTTIILNPNFSGSSFACSRKFCGATPIAIELRNARTDLALEKTASSGYRHENRELKRKLKVLETPKSDFFGFECVGVENANDYKVV